MSMFHAFKCKLPNKRNLPRAFEIEKLLLGVCNNIARWYGRYRYMGLDKNLVILEGFVEFLNISKTKFREATTIPYSLEGCVFRLRNISPSLARQALSQGRSNRVFRPALKKGATDNEETHECQMLCLELEGRFIDEYLRSHSDDPPRVNTPSPRQERNRGQEPDIVFVGQVTPAPTNVPAMSGPGRGTPAGAARRGRPAGTARRGAPAEGLGRYRPYDGEFRIWRHTGQQRRGDTV